MPCRHRSSLLSAGKPTYPVAVLDDCLGCHSPRTRFGCGNPRPDNAGKCRATGSLGPLHRRDLYKRYL